MPKTKSAPKPAAPVATLALRQSALVAMALASIEVYRRECVGLLIGRRDGAGFVVEAAIAYQDAERRLGGARADPAAHRRLFDATNDLPDGLQLVGDFHSHTEHRGRRGEAAPSQRDLADMLDGHVHVIVAVNDAHARRPFRNNADGSFSGTIGERHLRLAAFVRTARSGPADLAARRLPIELASADPGRRRRR